mmetsp:Transcript_18026/g.38888  ORF Transcript_18026/g.38888 Transcript_18026/m.38888 type:complete len:466 (+) Transcript_18026:227-1624(+)
MRRHRRWRQVYNLEFIFAMVPYYLTIEQRNSKKCNSNHRSLIRRTDARANDRTSSSPGRRRKSYVTIDGPQGTFARASRRQNLIPLRVGAAPRAPPPPSPSSTPVVVSFTCRMSKSGPPLSDDDASKFDRKSSGIDSITSLSILSSGSSFVSDDIRFESSSGLVLKGAGAEITALLGHSASSATALSSARATSFLSQGICVISPPATLMSNPILGGRERDTRHASHPGSVGRRPTVISLTGPSNRRFRIVTGILAPNDVTLISRSALTVDVQSNSRSKAMSRSPRSNSLASNTLGATSPMVNFFNVRLRIRGLSFAVWSSASSNADRNGAVSVDGKIRSNTYWMGIRPGTPTAAEYICVSFLMASTLSVNTRFTSLTPSLNACSAAGNRFLNPLIFSFPRSTSIVNRMESFATVQFLLTTISATSHSLRVFSFPSAMTAATNAAAVPKNSPPSTNEKARLRNGAL